MSIAHITEQHIRQYVTYEMAASALERALLEDIEPADDFPRSTLPLQNDSYLMFMASESPQWVGAKFMSVNPANPQRRLDRSQGFYILMDAETTSPKALIDGAELTELRTVAVTALVTRKLLPPEANRVVLYGYGAQARAHTLGLRSLHPQLKQLDVHGRDAKRAEMFAANAAEHGWNARIGTAIAPDVSVPAADLLVTATGSEQPLFPASWVQPGTLVIALGSHNSERSELELELLGRSNVIVEDVETALREAGEVAMAVDAGLLDRSELITVRDVVRGTATIDRSKPIVYKTVGMSWQDLIVAAEVFERVPKTALR